MLSNCTWIVLYGREHTRRSTGLGFQNWRGKIASWGAIWTYKILINLWENKRKVKENFKESIRSSILKCILTILKKNYGRVTFRCFVSRFKPDQTINCTFYRFLVIKRCFTTLNLTPLAPTVGIGLSHSINVKVLYVLYLLYTVQYYLVLNAQITSTCRLNGLEMAKRLYFSARPVIQLLILGPFGPAKIY